MTTQETGVHRHGERASLAACGLSIALIPIAALVWRISDARTGLAFLWASGIVAAVQVVVLLHLRLIRQEAEEELERKALAARSAGDGSALFESEEIDLFSAARARRQFERFFVPVFAGLVAAAQGFAAYVILRSPAPGTVAGALPAAVALAASAVAFILGRYLAALSSEPLLRPARAAGGQWLFAAIAGAAAALACAAGADAIGIPAADRWTSLAVGVVFGLLAVEGVINLVLEPYRPRSPGEGGRPLYESRLLDLLAQPSGLIRTAAEALDYQFGFRISETWFYRFLERAFLPLLAFQIVTLYLLSCVVHVAPEEVALLERFGRRPTERGVLDSGLHLKLPWPVDAVRRYPARRVLRARIGLMHAGEQHGGHDRDHDHGQERQDVILWTLEHGHDMPPYLVASREEAPADDAAFVPVNLLAVHAVLHYRISDVNAFAYEFADAEEIVQALAAREVAKRLITVDLDRFMAEGFGEVARELESRIQDRCDALGLGVRVVFFAFENVHPPTPVAVDFERVFAAQQAREAEVLKAKGERESILPDADARAARTLLEAGAEAFRIRTTAAAAAEQFLDRLQAFRAAPEVYRIRAYLTVLREALAETRKIVVAAEGSEVFILDFQQKLRPDLLDVPLSQSTPGGNR